MGKHPNDRLQGTLDLLVLKSLASRGPMHGYAMTLHIQSIGGTSKACSTLSALTLFSLDKLALPLPGPVGITATVESHLPVEGGLLSIPQSGPSLSLIHSSPCRAPAPALPLWSEPIRPTERPQQR